MDRTRTTRSDRQESEGRGPRRSKFLRTFVAIVIIATIAAIGVVLLVNYWLFLGADENGAEVVFEIQPGQGLRTISANLAGARLVRNAYVLELYGRWAGLDKRLQAGRYLISPRLAPVEILRKIVSGDAVFDEMTITIQEGWSLNDIEIYLEQIGLFAREVFAEAAVMQPAYRDFDFLAPIEDDTILDGYLFPDTYRVFSDSTPERIVRRMLSTFDQRVTQEMRDEIEAQGRTLHDVLTLASIVQNEAGGPDEMYVIAGVFWNRLDIWMPLESDATVNYVLGTSKRQPTYADTAVQDPYNTYQNYGLPPGPIGNPGLGAILAAINPAHHDYLFFLHPLGGDIVLSRTFEEHLANKARYLD
jgi:UPF0755 protein